MSKIETIKDPSSVDCIVMDYLCPV